MRKSYSISICHENAVSNPLKTLSMRARKVKYLKLIRHLNE